MAKLDTTWTLVYYQGGRVNGAWLRALPVATQAECLAQQEAERKAGRHSYTGLTRDWDIIGLPEGAPPRKQKNCVCVWCSA